MPIDANDMRKPAVVEYLEGYTIARLSEPNKYMDFSLYTRSYRDGKFLQEGYTPGQDKLDKAPININSDGLVIPPR